jgi:hypothetical protein
MQDITGIVKEVDLMPLENQLYGKLVEILLDGDGNIHFWIEKESKIPINALLAIIEEFKGKEILITFQPLIRKAY